MTNKSPNNPALMNLDTENMDLFEISMQNAILQGRIVKYVSDEGETLYKLSPQN